MKDLIFLAKCSYYNVSVKPRKDPEEKKTLKTFHKLHKYIWQREGFWSMLRSKVYGNGSYPSLLVLLVILQLQPDLDPREVLWHQVTLLSQQVPATLSPLGLPVTPQALRGQATPAYQWAPWVPQHPSPRSLR